MLSLSFFLLFKASVFYGKKVVYVNYLDESSILIFHNSFPL